MADESCVVSAWLDGTPFRWCTRDRASNIWLAYEQTKMRRGRSAHRLAGTGRTLAQLAESLRDDDGVRDLPHDDRETWGVWDREHEEQTRADIASGVTTLSALMRKARQEADAYARAFQE